jgi:spore photoproduct lyase
MLADTVLSNTQARPAKLWMPEQVLFTPAALDEPWGQQIKQRVLALNLPVQELPRNRLTGLRGESERDTYDISKRTLAVVTSPLEFRLNDGTRRKKIGGLIEYRPPFDRC